MRRGLYLVTPDWDDTSRLLEVTHAAIEGGAVCVQYRHKTATIMLREKQALALAELARRTKVTFIVNDDLALARAVGAQGVHVGEHDGDLSELRAHGGASLAIGVSCYNDFDRARKMHGLGADYLAFGAMYASSTKPLARAASLDLIARAKAELDAPIACIGGITVENAPPLVAAGADWLAVITDIYASPDPRVRAQQFSELWR